MNSRGVEIFCKSWMPKQGVRIKGVLCFCHGYGDTCVFFFEGLWHSFQVLSSQCVFLILVYCCIIEPNFKVLEHMTSVKVRIFQVLPGELLQPGTLYMPWTIRVLVFQKDCMVTSQALIN